jgi:integrase
LAEDAAERLEGLGPTLHGFALGWVEDYTGQDARLLTTFALDYFPPKTPLRNLDGEGLANFMTWLSTYRGDRGRLSDRSVANALVPLRLCIADAERCGLIEEGIGSTLSATRRRSGLGRAEGRFLTRRQLRRLMAEIPERWNLFFELLASTGLRVSEAIALRWMDLDLGKESHLKVRRSCVRGVIGNPKSRFGYRRVPLAADLVSRLLGARPATFEDASLVFSTRNGTAINPGNVRKRVLAPAVKRAGLSRIGFHAFRHTCASLLIERGLSLLRLQLWMGHHSAAYTIDTYGHLVDDELSPALDLPVELDRFDRACAAAG